MCAESTERPMLMMSSDLTMYTGNIFNSTPAASGPPGDDLSYAEAFPPLPTAMSSGNGADAMLPASPTSSGRSQWGKKMSVRSSTTTQVCLLLHRCVYYYTGITITKLYLYLIPAVASLASGCFWQTQSDQSKFLARYVCSVYRVSTVHS